ncbi:MAG TPA: GNAT family protein [Anaerolineales bacterium]|nr:GNAT family protein [Anaerolineales bacterium]
MKDVYTGEMVRLAAVDPETFGNTFTRWSRDSEFMRLLNGEAIRLNSAAANKKWIEKDLEDPSPALYFFSAHALSDDREIGATILDVASWNDRNGFVGISIGEREDWGKGYGTDLMKVLLRFAFTEVNLRRMTLTVFEYNPRAIRSYEKAGFQHEGRFRKFLNREGRRWDMLFMGILREDWLKQNLEGSL